jgi:hypothetical protein
MLTLQQLVGQRGQEVSLATQAMKAHREATREAIRNIG